MIHRELAVYHNYTPRMVLFPGWVFLKSCFHISIRFISLSSVRPAYHSEILLITGF